MNLIKSIKYHYKLYGFRFIIWCIFPARWIYAWKDFYYTYVSTVINPRQKRFRKVIPRTYCDITELILIVNFEFIKGFYEDEYTADIVNWNATPNHKKFSNWLKKAYKYITVDRLKLEDDIQKAYPPFEGCDKLFEKTIDENGLVNYKYTVKNPKLEYKKRYGKVERLEKLLKEKDHKLLKEMIDYREYFWT